MILEEDIICSVNKMQIKTFMVRVGGLLCFEIPQMTQTSACPRKLVRFIIMLSHEKILINDFEKQFELLIVPIQFCNQHLRLSSNFNFKFLSATLRRGARLEGNIFI